MVFSSLVFLYAFAPLTVAAYFLCPNRTWRNTVLLVASLGFYAWGEPRFVVLMLAACLVAYICGLLLHRWAERPVLKKAAFLTGVVLLLLSLGIFKYANFVCDNLRLLFPGIPAIARIALPIGISFYTFQILSYLIDLYWGRIGVQRNFFWLTLYVSFFPQLIAGPIVRYQTVEKEIRQRQETLEDVTLGTKRFIIGLAKKVILANNLSAMAEIVFQGEAEIYGTLFFWFAAALYALQIYFDFSGYSDMAIGLGQIFGFHFLENFNYPYVSLSVTEFWRRWHISLSSWFRDYVYIPMGGNRVSKGRWVLNLMTVWCLTGLWHGAQWNFILWGLYYGLLLLLEKLVLNRFLERMPKVLRWIYTMFLVLVGWMLFNFTEFPQLLATLRTLFVWTPTQLSAALATDTGIMDALIYVPLGLVCAAPISKKLRHAQSLVGTLAEDLVFVLLLLLCIVFIISSSYNPFIYFRF